MGSKLDCGGYANERLGKKNHLIFVTSFQFAPFYTMSNSIVLIPKTLVSGRNKASEKNWILDN